MMKDKNKKKSSFMLNTAPFICVAVFFLGIIISYYVMLTSETRQRIIKTCEHTAYTSSQEVYSYLTSGVHTMRFTCQILDSYIRHKAPQEEILNFMRQQSAMAEVFLTGNTTGIYGYINGEYLDGTDWVPEEGYIPTKRPWYIDARAHSGQIAIVGPYLDALSGTVLISFAKTLCDATSVAAMDFSLDKLQVIAEELATRNDCDMEIVLDKDYRVIVHSDKKEMQKQYVKEVNTFGSTLVEAMKVSNESYFSFTYEDKDYIAYSVPVYRDWHCISVFNSTSEFGKLRTLFIYNVASIIFVILALLAVLRYYKNKADITKALEEKAERAAAASEAKSSFLSNMSHEIRTPINAVIGMNEMILRESNEQNIVEYSENINKASHMLLGLVNDILDFSKIESGKMEIIPVDYEMPSLINDLVNMVNIRAEEKGLLLNLDFDEKLPKQLHGDEVRIKQVVTNLLTNAVKYTKKGSITFKIGFAKLAGEPSSVYIDFSVIDTGIGIKQEDMQKLFAKFERIDEKRNRTIEGTGLGLTIAKNLLEMMGSSLDVKSEYGKGSEFCFRLKQKVVNWESMGKYDSAYHFALSERKKYKEKFTAPEATVLMIDDTRMNLTVVKSLLKQTKVTIDTAESGDEGLELTKNKKYDIIFLDHMMPRKDGIETLHELLSMEGNPNRSVPIICLTANAVAGAREKYMAEGFTDYLSKPIEGPVLESCLMQYLPKEKVVKHIETEEEKIEGPKEKSELEKFYDNISTLSFEDAIKYCSTEEILKETIEQFYHFINPNISAIEEFLEAKDYDNYKIKVHALKSSARLIGANKLSADAKNLEDLSSSPTKENIEKIEELTPELIAEYTQFSEVFSPLYAAEEAAREDAPEISVEDLHEAYISIKLLADSFDIDSLDSIIAEIKKYRIPEQEKKKFEAIEECVRNMDWLSLEEIFKN